MDDLILIQKDYGIPEPTHLSAVPSDFRRPRLLEPVYAWRGKTIMEKALEQLKKYQNINLEEGDTYLRLPSDQEIHYEYKTNRPQWHQLFKFAKKPPAQSTITSEQLVAEFTKLQDSWNKSEIKSSLDPFKRDHTGPYRFHTGGIKGINCFGLPSLERTVNTSNKDAYYIYLFVAELAKLVHDWNAPILDETEYYVHVDFYNSRYTNADKGAIRRLIEASGEGKRKIFPLFGENVQGLEDFNRNPNTIVVAIRPDFPARQVLASTVVTYPAFFIGHPPLAQLPPRPDLTPIIHDGTSGILVQDWNSIRAIRWLLGFYDLEIITGAQSDWVGPLAVFFSPGRVLR